MTKMLIVAMTMVVLGGGSPSVHAQGSSGVRGAAGYWHGTYTCKGNQTPFELRLKQADSGAVRGSVEFSPKPGLSAIYTVTGQQKVDGWVDLVPVDWVRKPANLFMGTLKVAVSPDGKSMAGAVVECAPDKDLLASRVSDDPDSPLTPQQAAVAPADTPPPTSLLALLGLRSPSNSAKSSGADGGSDTVARKSRDSSSWEILGVRLGMTANESAAAIKATYPKSKRLDLPTKLTYGLFVAPEGVYGTQYIAGRAWQDQSVSGAKQQGALELGDESELIDVEYVWPSQGNVVAVSRSHTIGGIHSKNLPTFETVRKAVFDKYGEPDESHVEEGHGEVREGGLWGLNSSGMSGATWTWNTVSKQEKQRMGLINCAAAWQKVYQFSHSHGITTGGVSPECGATLTVTVSFFRIAGASSVTGMRFEMTDAASIAQGMKSMSSYMSEHKNEASERDNKSREGIAPKL